jgi:hypothetical protein
MYTFQRCESERFFRIRIQIHKFCLGNSDSDTDLDSDMDPKTNVFLIVSYRFHMWAEATSLEHNHEVFRKLPVVFFYSLS